MPGYARYQEQKIIPVFGDIIISEGQISEIIKKDFKDFISNPKQNPDADN